MKRTSFLFAAITCTLALFILPGCNDGGDISYNKDRAKKHIISLRQADSYREGFAKAKDSLRNLTANSTFLDTQFDLPVAEMFNRDAIALLLDQKDADGIRIYLGRDAEGKVRLVLLPVDKNGKDIRRVLLDDRSVTQQAGTQVDGFSDGGGQGIEVGQRCPTMCN